MKATKGHRILVWLLLMVCWLMEIVDGKFNLLEISVDHYFRIFPNVSYGLTHLPEHQHQCSSSSLKGKEPNPTTPNTLDDNKPPKPNSRTMSFTPNRRLQEKTANTNHHHHNNLQNAFILAVGGHSDSHYNYGKGGSINGLMAVWDSWIDNFFRYTSNTSSLILLFDERDYRRQNSSTTVKAYLDHIMVDNMNAEPVDCVRRKEIPSIDNIDDFRHMASNPHSNGHGGAGGHGHGHAHVRSGDGAAAGGAAGGRGKKHHRTHAGAGGGGGGNMAAAERRHLRDQDTAADYSEYSRYMDLGEEIDGFSSQSEDTVSEESNKGNGRGRRQLNANRLAGCNNHIGDLDQGYYVYFVDIAQANHSAAPELDGHASSHYKTYKPLMIFASLYTFPRPAWSLKHDEEELFKSWKPFRLNKRYPTNYGYVKLTNWYANYMIDLEILDYFDYAGKLDNDVSFISPFPSHLWNLPQYLASHQHYMITTQSGWYHDDPRIANGVELCLMKYMEKEVDYCQQLYQGSGAGKALSLLPGGFNDSTFFSTNYNTTFRAHFLVFWLGLYTAPETKLLANFWRDFHPWGQWDFRWGDQQWWPRPIALYGTGYLDREIAHLSEIDTENGHFIRHKEWPRYATLAKVAYYVHDSAGSNRTYRNTMYQVAAKPFIYR